MSTFLGFNSTVVAAGTQPPTNQSSFASLLTGYGWQIARQAVIPTSIGGTIGTPSNGLNNTSNNDCTAAAPCNLNVNVSGGYTPTIMYIQATSTTTYCQYAPMNFSLDWSTDGAAWTTLQTWTGEINWTPAERRKFVVSGATSKTWWRINVTAAQGTNTIYIGEWTLEDASKNWLSSTNFLDVIPPSGETIGDSYSKECIRIAFPVANTTLTVTGVQESKAEFPSMAVFFGAGTGSTPLSFGINNDSSGGQASFATNIMTLGTAPTTGVITIGSIITAAGVAAGTYITSLASGTLNVAGSTYTLSTSPGTITTEYFTTTTHSAGDAATFATNVMTLTTAVGVGSLGVGQMVYTTGVTVGTYITAHTGGTLNAIGSTYTLSTSPGTLSTAIGIFTMNAISTYGGTASFATNVMTLVTAPTAGNIAIGQAVVAAGVTAGTRILSLASGTLNANGSTYTLSTSPGTIGTEAYATVNGHAIQYTGGGANTTTQNARGLYELCQASTNPVFTMWNWIWPGVMTTSNGTGQFFAVQKIAAPNVFPCIINQGTGYNITTYTRASYCAPGIVSGAQIPLQRTTPIDAANGWIYYIQVNSRGLAITTKVNAGFTLPIHACYGDNATAVAQIPTSDLAAYGIPCTIAELIYGYDSVVSQCDGVGYPTHWWGVMNTVSTAGNYGIAGVTMEDSYTCLPNFSHHQIPGQIQDFGNNGLATNGMGQAGTQCYIAMYGEGLFAGVDSGTLWTIHKLGAFSSLSWQYVTGSAPGGSAFARCTAPTYASLDWYKFSGTAPANEQILIGPSNDFTTTITTAGTSSDATINVTSTSGFPSVGWIFCDGEIIQYTGTTGSTFTGCTRAKYNTTAVNLLSGSNVLICGWWVFFVQGLLFGGYAIPT